MGQHLVQVFTGVLATSEEQGHQMLPALRDDTAGEHASSLYSAEIENVPMQHPHIADAAVIGIPDERWSESVNTIITKSNADLTDQTESIAART